MPVDSRRISGPSHFLIFRCGSLQEKTIGEETRYSDGGEMTESDSGQVIDYTLLPTTIKCLECGKDNLRTNDVCLKCGADLRDSKLEVLSKTHPDEARILKTKVPSEKASIARMVSVIGGAILVIALLMLFASWVMWEGYMNHPFSSSLEDVKLMNRLLYLGVLLTALGGAVIAFTRARK